MVKRVFYPVAVLLFLLFTIPYLLYLQNSNDINVVSKIKTQKIIRAKEIISAERYCLLPVGTVVPVQEAKRIFNSTEVDVTSTYNSENYWFFAFFDNKANSIKIVPIDNRVLGLRNITDIYCQPDMRFTLIGEAVEITAENP